MKEIRYVQRDTETGEVVAHYSHPNKLAQEALLEGHPDLEAFRVRREERMKGVPRLRKLEERVAELERFLKGKSR